MVYLIKNYPEAKVLWGRMKYFWNCDPIIPYLAAITAWTHLNHPFSVLCKLLQGTEVCRARASPYDQIIICPGRQSNTAWEHELCIQQNQTSACHWSLPFGDGCGSINVSCNVVRSVTQHMETLWSRLTSNPQPLTQRVSVLARSSKWQKHCLALLGKTLCRKQFKY